MPFSSNGSATNTNVPGTAKSPVLADQLALVSSINTVTSHRFNLFSPPRHVAGSDGLARRRETAAI